MLTWEAICVLDEADLNLAIEAYCYGKQWNPIYESASDRRIARCHNGHQVTCGVNSYGIFAVGCLTCPPFATGKTEDSAWQHWYMGRMGTLAHAQAKESSHDE